MKCKCIKKYVFYLKDEIYNYDVDDGIYWINNNEIITTYSYPFPIYIFSEYFEIISEEEEPEWEDITDDYEL